MNNLKVELTIAALIVIAVAVAIYHGANALSVQPVSPLASDLQVQPLGHDSRLVPTAQLQGGSSANSSNLQPAITNRQLQ